MFEKEVSRCRVLGERSADTTLKGQICCDDWFARCDVEKLVYKRYDEEGRRNGTRSWDYMPLAAKHELLTPDN